MNVAKIRSLEKIEERMSSLNQDSFRYRVLACAKDFKTSWVELGRSLYAVFKDKLYKEWGYSNFDIYTSKEIGIRKQTVMKLLKSYYFLEKEEPSYLKEDYLKALDVAVLPSYESVDVLRMAKNKKLDDEDYLTLKKQVFEKGRDARELRRDLTTLIRQRVELEPEEARKKKKVATVRRFLSTLRALKQEIEISQMLPVSIIHEAESLIKKLELQVEE